MLRKLGTVLRESRFDVTAVVCDDLLIDLEPGDTTARRYALAFDLGTTTVVATLLDLETGQPVEVRSMLNRQQPFGADVISRISATMLQEDALDALQTRAQETLAQLADEVCAEARVDPGEVYEIAVCGNVTMVQLALGIDPEPLSMAPFVVAAHALPPATRPTSASAFTRARPRSCSRRSAPTSAATSWRDARDGDDARPAAAPVHRRRDEQRDRDRRPDRVLATAAPAGPAFEAAQIRCGMRAAEGAIEGVKIADGALELEVIGDMTPVGVCGSGLVDCVAELVRAGLLDHPGASSPRRSRRRSPPASPTA